MVRRVRAVLLSHKLTLLLLLFLLGGASASLGGATYPPQIVTLSFPANLAVGEEARGRVQFQDPDGDVTALQLAVVDGRFYNTTAGLDSRDRKEGNLTFSLPCTPFSQKITLQATLYDQAGNASKPRTFSITCGTPAGYNYDQEQATVRAISTRAVLNFFIIKDGVTALAERASSPQPQSLLEEPDPLVERAIVEALFPGLEGIWDQCGLGFAPGLVKVIDPEQLELGGRTLASQLFTPQGGERTILADGRSSNLLERALQALDPVIRAAGGTSILQQLNVFVVGSRISAEWQGERRDVEGFSGTSGTKYALIRWGAISFDEPSQAFLRPKQVTATLAHEIGHDLGLKHPDEQGSPPEAMGDQANLMWGSGVTPNPRAGLLQAQCQVASATLGGEMLVGPKTAGNRSAGQGTSGARIEFERPTEGATVGGEVELWIRGEGFQDLQRTGLARFELVQGGYTTLIGTDQDGSDGFSTTWKTGALANGSYILRAVLVDGRGQSAMAELRVAVAN
jgi:hypothetical protein